MNSHSLISPEQKDILAQVGMAVIVTQAVEQLIRLVTTYVIQGREPLTLEYFGNYALDVLVT